MNLVMIIEVVGDENEGYLRGRKGVRKRWRMEDEMIIGLTTIAMMTGGGIIQQIQRWWRWEVWYFQRNHIDGD